jgi:hypothetical protein
VAGPGDLFATAEELLAAAAEALDTIPDFLGTHLDGAPERQLISAGQPVADCCEQLAVWVNPITEGNRSPLTKAPMMQIVAPTFRVLATRCVPTGQIVQRKYVPPEAEALTAAAEQHMADGWALWNHLLNLINADLLFDRCGDLTRWSELPIAGGGCAGWELQFTVGLDGYAEELTT